jgi:hypothetical protein
MKAKAKAKEIGWCYLCSQMITSDDNYTAILQPQRVSHSDWTGCQKAMNRPQDTFNKMRQISKEIKKIEKMRTEE